MAIPAKETHKIIRHWIESSNNDFKTANDLFQAQSYHWALFIGHISVEKLLKAYYVKRACKHAPSIHNLYRLSELCDLEVPENYSDWMDMITSFNINARYDDYKKEFYDLCTREFAELWIERIKELRQWINQKF